MSSRLPFTAIVLAENHLPMTLWLAQPESLDRDRDNRS